MSEACIDLGIQYIYTLCSIHPTSKEVGFLLQFTVKNSFIKEDIRYLLAILNSKLTFQWIQYKGLVRGGVFEFSEKPLSIIPIRLIDWSNKEEILIHDNIVKEINSIIHNGITSKKIENIEKNVSLLYNVNF